MRKWSFGVVNPECLPAMVVEGSNLNVCLRGRGRWVTVSKRAVMATIVILSQNKRLTK